MKKVGLFFGGLSNEAEVSIMSAKNVVKSFDYKKYKLVLIYWNKKDSCFYRIKDINSIKVVRKDRLDIENFSKTFDVALLMTHGKYGEDGVLQAILEGQRVKYCGCRVLGSSVCMDKGLFKDLLLSQNINQVNYLVLDYKSEEKKELEIKKKSIRKEFKLPIYIKPANSGSSVGITKVDRWINLDKGIRGALKHDSRIIIEQGLVKAREIEVAVLGNNSLMISDPGELGLAKDFYDYDDKYKLGKTANIVPAQLTDKQKKELKKITEQAYRLSNCQGFARVDFLMSGGKIHLNEINTLPGFTDISMYPMLMMSTGLSYREVINRIIELGY